MADVTVKVTTVHGGAGAVSSVIPVSATKKPLEVKRVVIFGTVGAAPAAIINTTAGAQANAVPTSTEYSKGLAMPLGLVAGNSVVEPPVAGFLHVLPGESISLTTVATVAGGFVAMVTVGDSSVSEVDVLRDRAS